jgi:cell division septum initiation protein DivIVA
MSTDLQIDDDAREARRPNVAGDLPSMLEASPMFRRAVVGYDRFQVDTYVQWAEDELATADREREHLLARNLRTQAALEETRQLLPHSSSAGEFLQVSTRIGSLLAAAADEAEGLRADAEADRAAAAVHVQQTAAQAERLLADATDKARRVLTDAAADAARASDDARRVVAEAASEAEQVRRAALSEADTRLQRVRDLERRAGEQAEHIRRQATDDAAAALLHARDEVVRLLATGREQRRRADAEAAAARDQLERDVMVRTASLRAEVAALERRRTALRGEVRRLTAAAADRASARLQRPLPRVVDALHWRSRSLRAP